MSNLLDTKTIDRLVAQQYAKEYLNYSVSINDPKFPVKEETRQEILNITNLMLYIKHLQKYV